jgi:hypothetical protein
VRCSFARSSSRTRRASVWSCARFRERDAAADARFLRRRASRADSVPDGSEASEDAFVSSLAQTASLSPAVSSEREPRCEREARGSFRANLCWGSGKRGKRSNAANEASSAAKTRSPAASFPFFGDSAKCAASPASSRGGVDGETRAPWREPREVRAEARRGEAFSAVETRRATRREGRDGDAMVAPSSSRGARDRVARVARVQVERERGRVRVHGAGLEPRADSGQVDVRVVEVVRQRGRERGERVVAALRGGRVEREFALEERAQRRVGRRRGNGRGGGHRRNARRAPRARAGGGTTRAAGSASRVGEWRAGRGRDEAFSRHNLDTWRFPR